MNKPSPATWLALGVGAAPMIAMPWLVPESPLRHPRVAHYNGVVGYVVVMIALTALNSLLSGARLAKVERIVLGVFLAAMPGVYLGDWLMFHGTSTWLAIELGGQALFAAIAVVGVWKKPSLIAVGIAAHGVLWDAWHYHAGSTTPDWYAVGCLVVDLGLAGYYFLRLRELGRPTTSAA
jgi:hypothetical protein